MHGSGPKQYPYADGQQSLPAAFHNLVLDLIVTEIIIDRYPDENGGYHTKLGAKIVKGDALTDYARELNTSDVLVIGERGQGQSKGKSKKSRTAGGPKGVEIIFKK